MLREKGFRPRIGYGRLLVARNNIVVVRITGCQQVINLGNTLEP